MKWTKPKKTNKLEKFKLWLEDQGIRPSVRVTYLFRVGKYLKFTDHPGQEAFDAFREHLRSRGLKRSTLNGYSIAVKAYHRSIGEMVTYRFLKPNNIIPYYFTEEEVERIFACVDNFKHFAMLSVLFYAALRVSELANLDIQDVDLEARTIRVRDGKGGRYGIAYISQDCVSTLKDYLEMRKKLHTESPSLFLTEYGNRWDHLCVSRMVRRYKIKAGIHKPGSAHVLARHTVASILIKNGCDLATVSQVLRHKDIESTMRYVHISDDTRRAKYDEYLKI